MNRRDDLIELFKDKEFLAALNRYETMIAKGEQGYFDAEQLNDFASYYSSIGQDQKAEDAIKYALRLHPGDLDSTILLSRNFMIKNQYAEAIEIANSIKEKDDIEVRFLFAEINLCTNKQEKAMEILEDIAAQENSDNERLETYKDIIDLLHDYNEYELIERVIKNAVKEFPEHEESLWERVAESNKSADIIIEECKAHLDEHPYDIEAWTTLATAQFTNQLYAEALNSCEFILAIDPNNPFVEMKAQVMFLMGNWECTKDFEKAIKKAIDTKQDNIVSALALDCSTAYYQKNDFGNHLRMLKIANQYLDANPIVAYIVETRNAIAELDNGNFIEATAFYNNAKNLASNETELNEITIEFGIALTRNEMYNDAIKVFDSANPPTDSPIHLDMLAHQALCLLQTNHIEECIAIIETYSEIVKDLNNAPPLSQKIFDNIIESLKNMK